MPTSSETSIVDTLPTAPHAQSAADVIAALGATVATGLSGAAIAQRRAVFGRNTIVARRKVSAFAVLVHQFQSPVVYLLVVAAALAFYFGEIEEGIAIVVVLAVNAAIGFFTEMRAARSIEALRALGTRSARVRREGHTRLIPAEDLVPGDIVLIEGGDSVSADLRLIEESHLGADESTLTGESVAVDKSVAPVAADARPAERTSMLFKGTSITRGSGIGVVVGTGLNTELGHITKLVEDAEPESSPLERRLTRLSGQLVWAVSALTVILAIIGLLTGDDAFLMIEAAIALAVAAIPEGLPIVATLALARGMWRMARQNALIERLSAVETLGATTVILTDKTGTLTENRMTVRRLWVVSGEVEVTQDTPLHPGHDARLTELLDVAVLCNDATLARSDKDSSGDPMELALLRLGRSAGIDRRKLMERTPLVRKHAFETATKMMATVHRDGPNLRFAVKGAPEAVLDACTMIATEAGDATFDTATRAQWLARVGEFGHHGLRVIACARKTAARADAPPYDNLVFLGLIGLEDPARADVPHAIRDCRSAGIRVVMVTGDHAVTARAIGRAVGLGEAAETVIEGRHIARAAKDGSFTEAGIFARVSPAEKLALVRAYQDAGEIVAMTGDGVNDAPALRQADIGVAMGMRGTDVAREASAMILLDDAFPTIVKAVREGRVIFSNIRRFAAYLLSCNLSEVIVVGLAIATTLPLPIMPLQILYLNLVTDVFPAFALAMSEGESDVLKRPPRDPKEPILGRPQWITIVLQSLVISAATFGALAAAILGFGLDGAAVVTMTFLTIAFAQIWHVFNMRSPRSGLFRNEVTRNPWVWGASALCIALLVIPPYVPTIARVLHLVPPTPAMWATIIGLSLVPVLVTQTAMLVAKARTGDHKR